MDCLRAFVLCLLPWSAQAWEKTTVPPGFKMPSPLSLEDSTASLKVPPGFLVQRVAAEPFVMDPVHFDFGPDGRLWVAEMADYPLGIDGKGKAGGRVRVLEDTDGDGVFDRSTLFLEGLNFPTGVKAWRSGVLVIACPEIFYAEDRDGDGKADVREALFRGFKEGNQQHRVNGFAWGLDNWLYLANGDSGGTVESLKSGQKLELGSSDLKINPDTGEMAAIAGRTQYGRVRDDFGNWFGNNNSQPLWQFVLPTERMKRNPHVVPPGAIHQVPEKPQAPRVFPASGPAPRYNNPGSQSHFTSACGISIYRDRVLGEAFSGNAFICEPVHNLVHREVLTRDGLLFRGKRAGEEAESEFLASTDHWFRPVFSVTGPDGALWVADMHRFVIEHPEWIPKDWQKVLNLRAGEDKGRIYRIMNSGQKPAALPNPKAQSRREWLELLSHPNGWQRDMAHQLLLWSDGLKQGDLENSWETANVLGRIHLLGLFAEAGGVPDEILKQSLESGDTDLQRQGLKWISSRHAALAETAGRLAQTSDDPGVRFEAILALGELAGATAGQTLGQAALAMPNDAFFKAALASSLVPHLEAVTSVLSKNATAAPLPSWLDILFETATGEGNAEVCETLLDLGEPEGRLRSLSLVRYLEALKRRGLDWKKWPENSPSLPAKVAEAGVSLSAAARRAARDASLPPERRVEGFALLGWNETERASDIALLAGLIHPRESEKLALTAIDRLGEFRAFEDMLALWNGAGSAARGRIATLCSNREEGSRALLRHIREGKIALATLPAAVRQRLLDHPAPAVKRLASETLATTGSTGREEVLKAYAHVTSLPGNAAAGRKIFLQSCALCHEWKGEGKAIGADLRSVSDKSSEALLVAILDPNRAVEDKFQLSVAELRDGASLAGMIVSESENSVSLQLLDGSQQAILRTQLKGLKATGRSAMPEGLEATLTPRDLANLIAYLQEP